MIPPEWSVCVVARSAAQTQAVGAAIAAVVAPGDVVLLSGELGAGKTVLTKGLVAALGGGAWALDALFARRLMPALARGRADAVPR